MVHRIAYRAILRFHSSIPTEMPLRTRDLDSDFWTIVFFWTGDWALGSRTNILRRQFGIIHRNRLGRTTAFSSFTAYFWRVFL